MFSLILFLTQVVEVELARLPSALFRPSRQLWSVVYMPQVGFVVRVEGGRPGGRPPERLAEWLPDYALAFEGVTDGGLPGAFYRCGHKLFHPQTCTRKRNAACPASFADARSVIPALHPQLLCAALR